MTARMSRQHTAAGLGAAGATLGVLTGLTQAVAGSRIPDWSGDKGSPVALGLLTVLLSLAALAAALSLRDRAPLRPSQRVLVAVALLVPAGLCFSTVGRLWYVPGVLLLSSLSLTVTAGGASELWPVVRGNWIKGLVTLLGAFEILMAVSAGPIVTIAVGVIGGAVLIVAPWLADRAKPTTALAALLIGTLPFAALTYWSVASPVLALVALALAFPAMRRAHKREPAQR
jgi:hypothetical protein